MTKEEKEEFLNSKAGILWFRKKTRKLSKSHRCNKKRWILNPPLNVQRWNKWDREIKEEIKKHERM